MRKTIPMLLLVVALGACAGARGSLAFDSLRYPVSSSPYIFAPDGHAVDATSLERVGSLDEVVRLWGIFWSWIPITGTKDVSDVINARIEAAHGEGVINLALHVSNCGMNYIPFINWLPIYPGCTYVRVTGDIVKLAAVAPPAAPPPAAPPAAVAPASAPTAH